MPMSHKQPFVGSKPPQTAARGLNTQTLTQFLSQLTPIYSKQPGQSKMKYQLLTSHPLSKSVKFSTRRQAVVQGQSDQQIQLDSNFEGGNLEQGFLDQNNHCYLLLQEDTRTQSMSYWFNFTAMSVNGGRKKFIIVNLTRPLCAMGHFVATINSKSYPVQYSCQESTYISSITGKTFWRAEFEYELQPMESVNLSLSIPYTYAQMRRHLSLLRHHKRVAVEQVGKTVGGLTIEALRVGKQKDKKQKLVVVTARQHPCQTVSSKVCEALLDCLISSRGKNFLQNYTVLVIPMVNIDGVIRGNTRANLLGYDTNRCWDKMSPNFQGQSKIIWNYLAQVIKVEGKAVWTIDLHGHSQEEGFLGYFNQRNDHTVAFCEQLGRDCQLFRPQKCQFNIPSAKKESIRAQMQARRLTSNAVTIETSNFGVKDQDGEVRPFRPEHYTMIANKILDSIEKSESITQEKQTIYVDKSLTITNMEQKLPVKQIDKLIPKKQTPVKKQPSFRRSSDEVFKQIIYRRRVKKQCLLQRQTKVNSMKALIKQIPTPSAPQRQTIQRTSGSIQPNSAQIYNITFSRNRIKTQGSVRNMTPVIESPNKVSTQKSQQLHQSLDMRRKIRMAFESRLKTEDKTSISPSPRHSQIPIEYPVNCKTQVDFNKTLQPNEACKNINKVFYRRYNQPQFRLTSGAFHTGQ